MGEQNLFDSYSLVHEELHFPHWNVSSRIKFVCLAVVNVEKQSYVAFGTSNGSIYLFERRGTELFHLTTLKKEEEPVTRLRFSPKGCSLACALKNGMLIVFSLNFHDHVFSCVRVSHLHKASTIKSMVWKDEGALYAGDEKGSISVTFIPTSKSNDLMSMPSAPIQNLNSPVVQMDCCHNLIAVSTEKSAYLFDTDMRTFRTVGSKARLGNFGACFAQPNIGELRMFCARPGYRIWQTEGDNIVSVTHQYKGFSKMEETRTWGQPMALKSNHPRSGVFAFLASIDSHILLCIDVHSNFYFFDHIAQSALACISCPEDLVSYHVTRSGNIFLLLNNNRICALRFMPFVTAANHLIASSWISDAVDFLVSVSDREAVARCITEATINRLIEASGPCDANHDTLIALRDAIRERQAAEDEKLAEADAFPDVEDLSAANNGHLNEEMDDTGSDLSERSVCSSMDSQELENRSSLMHKRRSAALIDKMRTRFKATSDRVKQELSTSETAQNLVKMMKDTTTKIKLDASNMIVDKMNLMSPGAPGELDTSSRDLLDVEMNHPLHEKPNEPSITAPRVLNFIELEAVANICWERYSTQDRLRNDRAIALQLVRTSLTEFLGVVNRLLIQCHRLIAGDEPLPGSEIEGEAATMTASEDIRQAFPISAKLLGLCSRLVVLALFFKLSPPVKTEDKIEVDGELDKACQVSIFDNEGEPPRGANAVALTTLETILADLDVYSDYGFEETAFHDLARVLGVDVGFWRRSLRSFPICRSAYGKHLRAMQDLLRERCVKLEHVDWSSIETLHALDKSMVAEPLIGLCMLVQLFVEKPKKALRYCVQNPGQVSPRDVFNILMHHQRLELFLEYVQAMVEEEKNLMSGRHFAEDLKKNDDIFISIVVLSTIFQNKDIPGKKCSSCAAATYLTLDSTNKVNLVPYLFKNCGSNRSISVSEKWLLKSGYITQYSQALLAQGEIDELIQLSFNMDSSGLVLHVDRLSAANIELIVRLMIQVKPPSCLQCGVSQQDYLASWTWPVVGQLIAQNLPTPKAVQLLSSVDIPPSADLSALFQTFSTNAVNSVNIKTTRVESLSQTADIFQRCCQSWGVMVSDLSECYICGRLLLNKKEAEEIVITPCCHNYFHANCLPSQDMCIHCLK